MELEPGDNDVYGLVTRLCESIFHKYHHVEEHPYLPQQDNNRHLRRLKSKAYEILLNKSTRDYTKNITQCDPIIELLKYAFVLKVGVGRISQAKELEIYLDEFINDGLNSDSAIYSTLLFLNCLKSVECDDDSSLDIFYYGKPHPLLPEMVHHEGTVPPFQIYPIESFYLPTKFESMLKQDCNSVIKYNAAEPGSKLALLGRFTSPSNYNTQTVGNYNDSITNIPKHTTNLFSGVNLTLSSYFVPQIKDIDGLEDYNQNCKEGIVTEPETPWQNKDLLQLFAENNLAAQETITEICNIENDKDNRVENFNIIWEDLVKSSLSNYRTWETLGLSEPLKELPFASETVEATLHLINVAQDVIQNTIHPIHKVTVREFINNVKLLLLGVESNTFLYNSSYGFELKRNTSMHGISAGTLENMCYEVTRWGTCFKNLSNLIIPDPQTEKLKMEGLIFKALCGSIKEFLLFYHAAILKISIIEDGNSGLLKFLKKIRPLGNLIFKVAKLCRCDSQHVTPLGEGIGILTHIYKEVTKVTEQNVALVFYSILKDCCEVYFRFLQHWIFEGVCADIYEEFMIEVRPQYLRTRGHRFWTRAFNINKKSVPGFLSDLTDSILQCGKAVTLLKICDPQNPLCRVSASSQPPVRVCLSVGMLREQAKFYEEYIIKGELEQGEAVSLYSAIQEQKEAEKQRAELVIAAQQDTLLRLKKEREDALLKIAKEKNLLLEQLKDQAEEVAQRKERDRDAELLADKLFLESILKEEEEAKNIEKAERESTIKYYNELAEEAKRRRIHADWRIRRMKLFDERVSAILNIRREYVNTPDEFEISINFDNNNSKVQETNKGELNSEININKVNLKQKGNIEKNENVNTIKKFESENQENANSEVNLKLQEKVNFILPETSSDKLNDKILNEDENKNPTLLNNDELSLKNQNIDSSNEQDEEQKNQNKNIDQTFVRALRPTVLDISGANNHKYMKEFDRYDSLKKSDNINNEKINLHLLNLEETGKVTEAQRNKLKILQHEYLFESVENSGKTSVQKTNLNLLNLEESDKMTEAQRNKLKILQHEYLLDSVDNSDKTSIEKTNLNLLNLEESDKMTEAQRNKLKILQHEYLLESVDNSDKTSIEKTNLNLLNLQETENISEAQRNKIKVLKHEFIFDNLKHIEKTNVQKPALDLLNLKDIDNLTDAQRNKLKVLQQQHVLEDLENTEESNIQKKAMNLLNLYETDNMTESQRNKLKVLRQEFGITPNNNESITILTAIQNVDKQSVLTEFQLNRLRNTEHMTHLNWNDPEIKDTSEKLPLTEAQLNRNKIMSHFYNRMEELENTTIKSENLTEWQKNRNRNMAHNTEQFDFIMNRFTDLENLKETPMSTATDHFTISTHSSCLPMQSCENTPFSEITNHSDMLFTRSSDGMSTDETSQSRASKYFPETPAFPNFIGFCSVPNTPSTESQQLTVADVEMIDTTSLQVYLEKSVVIPLTVQSRLVNNAIIKYLLNEHKMLSHLHSLRSYFFLLNGEFAKTLTQSLFTRLYEISAPVELFNSSTLTNFLEKALVSSLSGTYANSELLSLSATEVPAYLQTSNPEILSCLSLNYKISWPLNIIFNDIVMQQYSRVFKFLLMVGRVLWVLKEDFQILKIERKASITKNHHKLQLYRHSMMQFMNALHTYLTCSVLHASWSEFEKELEDATTLDEVYDTHISYIKKILSRCMLNVRGEKMRTCLCNIFKVVLKFHNHIRAQNWSSKSAGPNYENLERMYVAFCEQRAYLAHVAEKLANAGYQPHLMQFLHALNLNYRYDFTSKK